MQPSQPTEKELLRKILLPLLEDFKYWFSRSSSLLESENMPFLSEEEQTRLLTRLKQAQGEVETARMLFNVTDGQAGVDTQVLLPWHQLVAECWDVARRWREIKQKGE
ncbi:DUF2605 domain-containing protein [Cyanobacterium sp. Dongsha4]|uniref:DUF2605 domain-containing protein n=1 Tax=Cyanobacterium sp. DS4 TaxID=2878255 RepID=UPI002E804A04|nr:DUF2605 domain-containing protein [Cyanobacterium sp. Dongsha4]WVK98915.1 DUF2605 domain-containing protein [Cyanobacterium sp. Dongsha4]